MNPADIDTAAVRAEHDRDCLCLSAGRVQCRTVMLLDALDAAQARAADLAAEVARIQVALRSAEARATWSGHQCESLTRENGTLRMERDRGWERAEAAEARATAAEVERWQRVASDVERAYTAAEAELAELKGAITCCAQNAAAVAAVRALCDTEMDTGNSYAADGWVAAMDAVLAALSSVEVDRG